MSAKPSFLKKIFCFIWNIINGIRKLILNLIVIGLLIAIVIAFSEEQIVQVEPGSALVLNLAGEIVEQKKPVDPFAAVMESESEQAADHEILLADVIKAIQYAAEDKQIAALVLELDQLQTTSLSKLQSIADALTAFKASGKKIIAYGDNYQQSHYFLASFADAVYLNPQGMVLIEGLSRYRQYFQSALNKLNITINVFRVGTFKSAIEPLIRDNMSPAAKEANLSLLDDLWQNYIQVVAKNRQLPADQLLLSSEQFIMQLEKADNDLAQVALNLNWVDSLSTHEAFRLAMIDKVGKSSNGNQFKQVDFDDYLPLTQSYPAIDEPNKVAIIVAKGTILNGQQPSGEIGGESTAKLLRKARFDDNVKALVLRIDSPGGSAFASEQIRQELLAIKAVNKPVVVSMGSYAASGGYWIAADADYIYATPSTLTGSIGIFGMLPTFQDTLAELGIYTDGVSTHDWAGFDVTQALNPQVKVVIQRSVEHGYDNFISLVANARNMSKEAVDSIAQGRVWTGRQALANGLVDELGDLPQAITKAAELASLTHFDTKLIEQQLSPQEQLIQDIFGSASAYLPAIQSQPQNPAVAALFAQWQQLLSTFASFDDPNGLYLYCERCDL